MNTEASVTSPSRRVLRFGLGTLLFVVLVVAGVLGGIKAGFQRGYLAGQAQRIEETPVAKLYPVASLVLATPDAPVAQADFDTLIDLITCTIAPESWDCVGGPGSIAGFPHSLSLVVTQTPPVHARIAVLLRDMEVQREAANDALRPSAPAQGSTSDH